MYKNLGKIILVAPVLAAALLPGGKGVLWNDNQGTHFNSMPVAALRTAELTSNIPVVENQGRAVVVKSVSVSTSSTMSHSTGI